MKNLSKPCFSISRLVHLVFILLCLILVSCGGSEDTTRVDIEAFLANAKSYRDQGQYQAAIIESRNAMQASPDDVRGHISLAEVFVEIGQAREAIRVLENIDGEGGGYILSLANSYSKSGKFRSARELLDANDTVLTDHGQEVNLLLAQVDLATGQIDEAEKLFRDLLAADEGNNEAMMGLARVFAVRGDFTEVQSALEKILQMEPNNAQALLFASVVQTRNGDLGQAEELLMTAVSSVAATDIITPLRYSILASLRDNLTQQGKTSEALIYSGLLAESTPGAQEAAKKFQDVMNAVSKSNFDGARQLLDEIRIEAPNSERAGTLLGVVEYLQGDNKAAIQQFEQFVDPETAAPMAMRLFAMAELKLNQPEKVLSRLKHDIDDSKDGKLVALYGIAATSAGDVVTGEKYLLKSIRLDEEDGRLRLPLARLYNVQGKRQEALQQIRAAFKSQPSDALIQGAYIEQLRDMQLTETAGEIVNDLRASFPESQQTQLVVATYYLSQQKFGEAKKILEKVLRLGESKPARHQLARINLTQKEYVEAESRFRELIKLDAEDSEAYKGLITVYERQDRVSQGIEEVVTLVKESKATAPILVLSEYYGRNGEFDQAFELVNQFEPKTPEAARLTQNLFVAKANQLLRRKELDESRKTILEGLTEAADNPRLLAILVGVELAADNLAEAEKVYGQLKDLVPGAPITTILAGDIEFRKKDFSGAKERYQLVWNQIPSDQIAVKIYSVLRQLSGIEDPAMIEFIKEWEEKLPRSQLPGLALGGQYMQAGAMDSAKHAYQELLETYPDVPVAHNNLAWIYGEKDLDNALASGKRAFELAPDNAEIMDTYAWFLYKSGDAEQAKELLARAVDLAPDNQEILAHFDEVSKK